MQQNKKTYQEWKKAITQIKNMDKHKILQNKEEKANSEPRDLLK